MAVGVQGCAECGARLAAGCVSSLRPDDRVWARRGVLNVVHGSRPAVTSILDHPDIRAVSFVGSDQAGRYIYERGCANGKRVQARSRGARRLRPGSPLAAARPARGMAWHVWSMSARAAEAAGVLRQAGPQISTCPP